MRRSARTERTTTNADSQGLARHPTARSTQWQWPHIAPAVSQLRAASHSARRRSSHCQTCSGGLGSGNEMEFRKAHSGLSARYVLAGAWRGQHLCRGSDPWVAVRWRRLRECHPSASSRGRKYFTQPNLRQARHRRRRSNRDPRRTCSERSQDQLRARVSWTLRSARLGRGAPRRTDAALAAAANWARSRLGGALLPCSLTGGDLRRRARPR